MMGVPVRKTNKQGKARKKPIQVSADELFMRAEVACMNQDFSTAHTCFQKCLAMEPNNIEFLDAYGAFLAEYGDRREAITVLQKACSSAPDVGFEKFMYLGQVLDADDKPKEAEAAMRQGIQILRREVNDPQAKGEEEEHQRKYENLSSALCSLAELLMGVLHEAVDEAEDINAILCSAGMQECEALLIEARQLWSSSPEPLQAMCSLRILQCREEEALELLKTSLGLWHRTSAADEEAAEEEEEGKGPFALPCTGHENLPSYEFRFETAKLLLELDETTSVATEVLVELLEENDSVPDVWLLLAVAYRAGGELECAAEASVNGVKVARLQGLPENHEVVAALDELARELDGHLQK